MSERNWSYLAIEIIRFISWDPQPGIVACELIDADDQVHIFIDKIPIFTALPIDEDSPYPLPAVVRCDVLNRWSDGKGRELARVRTEAESTTGLVEFTVLQTQVSQKPTA